MNKTFGFTNKKTMSAGIGAIAITLVLSLVSLVPRGAHGEFDLTALVAQQTLQQQELDNHDARIGNNEKSVEKLQSTTTTDNSSVSSGQTVSANNSGGSSTSSSYPVVDPAVTQADPAPYVVKSVEQPDACIDSSTHRYWQDTYSDGTIKTRTWVAPGQDCTVINN